MKKVLKVKDYIQFSKGQFIPREYRYSELKKRDVIYCVTRIRDSEEFTADVDFQCAYEYSNNSGFDMSTIVCINSFNEDCIHAELYSCTHSEKLDRYDTLYYEVEINMLEEALPMFLTASKEKFMTTFKTEIDNLIESLK